MINVNIARAGRRTAWLVFSLVLALGLHGAAQSVQRNAPALPTPRFVYVTNHQSRDVSAFIVSASSGALSPVAGSPFPVFMAPTGIVISPDGRFAYLATDESAAILMYRIEARGALEEVPGSPVETRGVIRQLAVDHAGKYLYATTENGALLTFAIHPTTGQLIAMPGHAVAAGHGMDAHGIAIGADDKFVFVGDATLNTIKSFAPDEGNGALAPTGNPAVNTGLAPGKIAVSGSGTQLFVADTGSDSISVFAIDPLAGTLAPVEGSPFVTLRSPGDMVAVADGQNLFVASTQGAGLSGIAIPSARSSGAAATAVSAEPLRTTGTLALASDAAGRFLFAADASTNTVTRYLLEPVTHKLVSRSAVSYPTGTSPGAIALANSIPDASGTIAVSLASGSLLTFASTTGSVQISPAATQGSDLSCAGQVINLAFSVPSIGVISTTAANPATSVCIPIGATTAAFTVTTAAVSGSSVLTGFATGLTDGTTNLSVSLRTITLSLPFTNIGVGNTVTGAVTLANPAPTGGATVTLHSSATQTATISAMTPTTIPAGSTTGSFTVTGVQANTASLSATVAAGGYSSTPLGVTVFPPGLTISLPHNQVVAPGQSLPYPISIGAPAAAALSVTLVKGGAPGTVTFSTNPVIIAKGATTASTNITGVHIGPLNITGSAIGFASDTENATVQITLTFNPNTLNVESGATANLTLSASSVAPTGGFTINLASTNPAFATVPATILIPAGSSTVSVPVKGVSAGVTTVNATAPGAIAAAATVTDFAPPAITLRGPTGSSAVAIGKDAIVSMSGSLAQAAPLNGLTVTIKLSSAANMLLSSTPTAVGTQSITVNVPAGQTNLPTFYAQATAATGTPVITASAPGYSNGTATTTIVPSGFTVFGGTPTTTLAATSQVTVYFAQLDPSTLAVTANGITLRPGVATVTVNLTNSDHTVGGLGAAAVTFNAGEGSRTTTFQPHAVGTAVIGINNANLLTRGFKQPSNDATTTFTVTTPTSAMSFCTGNYISGTGVVSLGYDSSCAVSAQLEDAAPLGGRTVTLTSNSPNLLLSNSATIVGAASITVTIPVGSSSSPAFYVQVKASSGSATITESVPGYGTTTATIDFTPSAFTVFGGTSTTTFAATSAVTVYFAQLDPNTLTVTRNGITLRPGISQISVALTNSNNTVGGLGAGALLFNSGDTTHSTTFQPRNPGTATIGFSETNLLARGFTAPSNEATTTFTVTAPNSALSFCTGNYVSVTGAVSLGRNRSCAATPQLATAAPAGNATVVTLTSSDPSSLLLSTSATTSGTGSVKVNIPAGGTSAPAVYVQVIKSSGSATITETVPGYNPTATTVNFTPSGFTAYGGTTTTTLSGTSTVTVYFAQLDPTTLAVTANAITMRPGASAVTVPLKNSAAAVGTLGSSSLIFNPGDTTHSTTFQPVGAGTSIISFGTITPANYTTPSNNANTTFIVSAPNSAISFCTGNYISSGSTTAVSLGYNRSCASSAQLATAAPSSGVTVTLSSSNPAALLLSTSPTAVGTSTITLPIAAGGTSSAAFYVQALTATGSATITETVPGYNSTAATINFTPSGFTVYGGTTTTTLAAPSTVTVYFAQLDPLTLAVTANGITLRPGAGTPTVGLTDNNNAVGTLGASSMIFNPGDTSHSTTFQPVSDGAAVIGFSGTLAGYATPSSNATTTFTVATPNSAISFCTGNYISGTGTVVLGYDRSCASSAQLADPAPAGGSTITLTSNSANLLLSTSATTVGTTSITLNIPAGSSSSSAFYVQTLASTGSATITETVPQFNPTTATINFTPSGFTVYGGTSTSTLSGTSTVTVYFAQLDPTTLAVTANGITVRPGVGTLNVGLTDSNASVGTLSSSSIAFNPGDTNHSVNFQPAGAGTAIIGFGSTLAGFATPSANATTTFTVTAPSLTIQPLTIGNYLQATTYAYLGAAVPTGGTTVTITAPASALLSTAANTKGTATLSFPLTAGQSSTPLFYVQSQGAGAGTVTLNISAPLYASGTGTVTVYPSGFALQGSNFSTTTSDNPTTLTIVPAALDPKFLTIYQVQELIPGPPVATGTLHLTVQSGTAPVGTFSVNSVSFTGDDTPNFRTSSFTPVSAGSALITITSSAGFTNASTELTATVTP